MRRFEKKVIKHYNRLNLNPYGNSSWTVSLIFGINSDSFIYSKSEIKYFHL